MLYAIGDIHGQAEKLRRLLDILVDEGLGPDDDLVFLGDYVDRGPDSAGVMRMLLGIEASYPRSIFLRGNHEQMMIEARSRYDRAWELEHQIPWNSETSGLWFSNGAVQTLKSYKEDATTRGRWWEAIPEEHWEFVLDTEMEHKTEHYWFVHAGVLPPGAHWEYETLPLDPRLWVREPFILSPLNFGRMVVFGHTPTRTGLPLIMQNKVGLDTGAGWGGDITAMRVNPDQPFDAKRAKFYSA
jgi:serine/threonine protein phosphatase 1